MCQTADTVSFMKQRPARDTRHCRDAHGLTSALRLLSLTHLRNHRSVHEPAVANTAASFTHTARSSPRHTRHMRRLRQRRTRTTGDHDSLLSSLSAVSHFWTRSDLCSYADSSCTSSPHSRCSGVVHTYTLVSTPPPPHHTHHMHIARAHCRNTAVAPRLV